MPNSPDQRICRYVDMWTLPGVHPTNVELLQQLKTADTQHFTKNMDVVGTVSERDGDTGKWEKTHLIGVRTDIWSPDEQELASAVKALQQRRRQELKRGIKRSGRLTAAQTERLDQQLRDDGVMQLRTDQVEKRRLVLKLFKTTAKRLRWCGTLEEITTTEVHNSLGSRRTLLTTAVMLPRCDYVTQIHQNHRTFRIPAIFTFCFYLDMTMWHVTVQQRWFSLGVDFDVTANGQSLGKLDGKLISLGADSYLRLLGHALTSHSPFVDLLTLFTASVGYHRAMRKSIRRRMAAMQAGESHRHIIEDEELRLRHNGRAAA